MHVARPGWDTPLQPAFPLDACHLVNYTTGEVACKHYLHCALLSCIAELGLRLAAAATTDSSKQSNLKHVQCDAIDPCGCQEEAFAAAALTDPRTFE